MVLGVLFGTCLAIARLFGPPWLSAFARLYTDTFRSIPLILTIFWVYFLVPYVLRAITGNPNLDVGPVYAALTAFVLAEAAYFGEIIRGGLAGVPEHDAVTRKSVDWVAHGHFTGLRDQPE